MNRLEGIIAAINQDGPMCLIDVAVGPDHFSAMLLLADTHFAVGMPAQVLFKETEVSLAKELAGLISLRNRHPGVVTECRLGKLLAEVTLDYRGQRVVSLITRRSAERLNLQPGDAVEWLIKANELTLTQI